MKSKIQIADLKNYKKDFQLEAQLINGTLIGHKDNKVSCIARVVTINNNGEKFKGIRNTNGSALLIEFDKLENWIIEATELS